jgi:hypothetical protein
MGLVELHGQPGPGHHRVDATEQLRAELADRGIIFALKRVKQDLESDDPPHISLRMHRDGSILPGTRSAVCDVHPGEPGNLTGPVLSEGAVMMESCR